MWRRIVCHLLHSKYHEVGTSEAADISKTRQIWQCQWWCKRCSNHWRVWTTIEMLEEPKWEPSVEGFIELGRQRKEANRIERLKKEKVDAK